MNWRVVISIVQKDLIDALKNLYLLFCILMPIGMSLLFQVALPDEDQIGQAKIVLFAPEESRYSAMLSAYQDIEIIAVSSEAQIPEMIDGNSEIAGGVAIEPGFDARLDAGEKPVVKAWLSPKAGPMQSTIFRSLVVDQAWLLVRQDFPIQLIWPEEGSPVVNTTQNGPEMPFDIDQYVLQIMLVMGISMMGAFLVPTLMVEEKEKHTLEALLVSPGGPVEVTVGKAIVGIVYSLLVSGVLLAMNGGFTGNWPVTVAGVFLGALFVVGIGLLMGSLFNIMHHVNIASSVIMLLMFLPPWMGLFSLPAPFDRLLPLIPTFYLSNIVDAGLNNQASLALIGDDFAILAACAIAVLAAVVWALRRERK